MLLRLAITAAILAYLANSIDMAEAARAIAAISLPHLLPVLVLVAIDRAVMILRWVLLLRASGNPITTADATRLFLVSSFVGSFCRPAWAPTRPARTAWPARIPAAARPWLGGGRSALGVVSLVRWRIIGLIAWAPQGAADWRIAGRHRGGPSRASQCSGPTSGCGGSCRPIATRASSPAACCGSGMRWAATAIAAACSST